MLNTILEPFMGKTTAREVSGTIQALGGAKNYLKGLHSAKSGEDKLSALFKIGQIINGGTAEKGVE